MLRASRLLYSNWLIWSLVIVAIAVAAKGVLFAPQDIATLTFHTHTGHEWDYNVWRILGMANALSDGMPGRWLADFSHGWGYPLFHYTGPLPYTLGGLLVLSGVDPNTALNYCWIAAYAGAGLAMFWSTRPIFGRWGALLAAVCYLLAPYHLVDTYIRTNLVETTAFVFPPLVLRALWHYERPSAFVLGALGVALIPLTHPLSTYLIGLGLVVFTLTCTMLLPAPRRKRFFLSAGAMGAAGLALSAFFWLPALADAGAVKGFEAMTAQGYEYETHFVYFSQLLNHYWGYGGSSPGRGDYMSFSLGPIIAVTALLAAALATAIFVVTRKQPASWHNAERGFLSAFAIAAFVAGTAMAFMTLNWSAPLWRLLPKVELMQFPWRFLLPASLFLALCAGALPRLASLTPGIGRRWVSPLLGLAVATLVVAVHWDFAKAGNYDSRRHQEMTASHIRKLGVWTTNQLEFLPENANIPYREAARKQVTRFLGEPSANGDRIAFSELGHGRARVKLRPGPAGTLILNQHWHPAWRASVNGQAVPTYAYTAHPFAPVAVDVPENAWDVEFKYGFTAAGYAALALSLSALAGGMLFLYRRRDRRALAAARLPALLLAGVLVFYWSSSFTRTQSIAGHIADIDHVADISSISTVRRRGSSWDYPGNIVLSEAGARIRLGETVHSDYLEISVDSNDHYIIGYLKDGELKGMELVPPAPHGGLAIHTLNVPGDIAEEGYDAIAAIPLHGDGYYSVGHLLLLDEPRVVPSGHGQRPDTAVKIIDGHQVSKPKSAGSAWDGPGNIVMDEAGVTIKLEKVVHAGKLEVSADSNDVYLLRLMNGDSHAGTVEVPFPDQRYGGLGVHRLEIPPNAAETGFDRVIVIPFFGDGRYSLGHLRFIE